jgi:trehalose 6-phosphate synthase
VLRGRRFLVVSNRAPYIQTEENGRIVCKEPAGGLTAALKPIIASAKGTWVAHGGGSPDQAAADRRGRTAVPPEQNSIALRQVWIPEQLHRAYYAGLSNQGLWPLCHNVYQRPAFRNSDWQAYRNVNRLFADAVLEEIGDSPAVVFVQDYHLALLPRMLRRSSRDIIIGQFWHIPWPAAEIIQTFPWLEELLDGMLGNDMIGFHLDQHCRNFIEAVSAALPVYTEPDSRQVVLGGQATQVRAAPISIDFECHSSEATLPVVTQHMSEWRRRIGPARQVVLGIDRLDYTKGLPERLRGFAIALERLPELHGRITMVQVAVPSRSTVPEFAALEREIDERVAAINQRWGTANWRPVILEKRNLDRPEMTALHRLADVCLVTSLHDGMNLVAKEFVASRFDGDGVLVLSRFAGAARELAAAIQVNPFSEDSIADAIGMALAMPVAERLWRMSTLRSCVRNNNVYSWGATLLREFAQVADARMTAKTRPALQKSLAASVA